MGTSHNPKKNAITEECRASYAMFEMKDLERLYAVLPDRTVQRLDLIEPVSAMIGYSVSCKARTKETE